MSSSPHRTSILTKIILLLSTSPPKKTQTKKMLDTTNCLPPIMDENTVSGFLLALCINCTHPRTCFSFSTEQSSKSSSRPSSKQRKQPPKKPTNRTIFTGNTKVPSNDTDLNRLTWISSQFAECTLYISFTPFLQRPNLWHCWAFFFLNLFIYCFNQSQKFGLVSLNIISCYSIIRQLIYNLVDDTLVFFLNSGVEGIGNVHAVQLISKFGMSILHIS